MTHTVTESIYSGKDVIVPLADVQHIETHNPSGLIVVTKHTRWDWERDGWANNIWIDKAEADAFKTALCRYRSEIEADTLCDLAPEPPPCERNYAGRVHKHPRFPSGDCVECGALCTQNCKHPLAVGEYAPEEPA